MRDLDVCQCGDYRRDHVGGVGACKFNLPHNIGHGGPSNCTEFRMSAQYQPEFYGPGFHWREGLYFKRLANGDVQFSIRDFHTAERTGLNYHGDEPDEHYPTWVIPAAEWVSIVAAVSAGGSTSETYAATSAVHDDPKHPVEEN